jgi:hypothetical protein
MDSQFRNFYSDLFYGFYWILLIFLQVSSAFDVLHMKLSMAASSGLDFSEISWLSELRSALEGVEFIPVLDEPSKLGLYFRSLTNFFFSF